jgi:hypothetical protein
MRADDGAAGPMIRTGVYDAMITPTEEHAMPRNLPSAIIAAAIALVIAAPAAAASGPALTIYSASDDALFSGASQGNLDAGNAVVHEQRDLSLKAGTGQVRIGGLPASVDPEAIAVGFDNASGVTLLGRRVVLANGSASGALDGAIGQQVTVTGGTGQMLASGTLVAADADTLTLRLADGRIALVRNYATVTLPPGAASGGSTLLLDVDARSAGTRAARLTYATSGLGWRAAYTATLTGGATCRMHFDPQASIANRSGSDYHDATVKLIAGQPNLGNPGVRMYNTLRRVSVTAEAAPPMPVQRTLGDYRSFTLPGAVSLPDGTVTLAPLYGAQDLPCRRQYVVEDGSAFFPPKPNTNDYGGENYSDRPIASTLSFAASHALPAGTLRAWVVDHDGAPELLGQGDVADTPKGGKVSVQLGESFDLRASRERTAFHVDIKTRSMSESFRIKLTNGGEAARTVEIREHPNRWRQWTLTSSSVKPSKQTPQLLGFEVNVPANGSATLDYAVRYTWAASDE